MKKYSVEYDPHVMKKLAKLDAPIRNRIKTWIDKNLIGCEIERRVAGALAVSRRRLSNYRQD